MHRERNSILRVNVMNWLTHDFRRAARVLRKEPRFSALAIVTLALGIGATTAVFSVVYGVLLKPLPFDDADRLVALNHRASGFGPGGGFGLGADNYFTYRDNARVFEDIGLWRIERVSL